MGDGHDQYRGHQRGRTNELDPHLQNKTGHGLDRRGGDVGQWVEHDRRQARYQSIRQQLHRRKDGQAHHDSTDNKCHRGRENNMQAQLPPQQTRDQRHQTQLGHHQRQYRQHRGHAGQQRR